MGELFQPVHLLILMFVYASGALVSQVIPLWLTLKRAGLVPALSLLALIPFAGLIVRYDLALAAWPKAER